MATRDDLLDQIETFLQAHDMAASEFGRAALNDTSLVKRLREGADVRLRTADRIREFMRKHKARPKTSVQRSGMAA